MISHELLFVVHAHIQSQGTNQSLTFKIKDQGNSAIGF